MQIDEIQVKYKRPKAAVFYISLRLGKPVSPKSQLCSLNIFLDENSQIRVGERLIDSYLSQDNLINPVILPD